MSLSFGVAYARGDREVAASGFLPAHHRDAAGRRAAVERSGRCGLDPVVRAALLADNATAPRSTARLAAMESLADPRLTVVVTGQQVGLFVGPLYSLWKAATAVVWADRLAREFGRPVVPVFWMQTEDHDLDEIARCTVSDPRGGVHETAVQCDGRARASICDRALGADVSAALDRVAALLRGLPHIDPVMSRLSEAYRPGARYCEAFARVLLDVFADTGLLVLQPRTAELAAVAAPVHEWALSEHAEIARALAARGDALRAAGYAEQVAVRGDCSLTFFHALGANGPRFRLARRGDTWTLADGADTPVSESLEMALSDDPLRFSTSTLLRPLVQDTLLPTAAYVGGPGELSYWAQVAPLYALRGLPLPLVIPRATGMLVDGSARADLDSLGLTPSEITGGLDAVLDRIGPPRDAPDFSGLPSAVRDATSGALASARSRALALDPTLEVQFRKTEDAIAHATGKLHRRLELAALRSDPERVAAAERVVARLRPQGSPQDRSLCWPDVAARVGVDRVGPALIDGVTAAVEAENESTPIEVFA